MKVVFLDLDGVLNSFSERKGKEISLVINKEKVEKLKRIVDETGATLVLSSSWRKYWNRRYHQQDSAGWIINQALAEFGLEVWDKIPVLPYTSRNDEIRAWLVGKSYIDALAILDDKDMAWDKYLRKHWVQPDGFQSGLTEEDADRAIRILNHGPRVKRRLFKFNKRKEDFL